MGLMDVLSCCLRAIRNTFWLQRLVVFLVMLALACEQHAAEAAGRSPVDREEPLCKIGDGFGLADGPAWDSRGFLIVSDVKNQTLHRYFPKKQSWLAVPKVEGRLSGLFQAVGDLYAADNSGGKLRVFIGGLSAGGEVQGYSLAADQSEPVPRANDLVVDRRGGAYVTVTNRNEVVYVEPGGASRVVTDAVPSPNGIILSPDQQTLYVANYRGKSIEQMAVKAPGELGPPQRFAVMDDGEALGADGMTIDRAGNVYCAGATAVWIWDADGVLLEKLECPTRPINATFGGADDRSLFITCFDGVYEQRMLVPGRPAQPPLKPGVGVTASRPDPGIPAGVQSHLDVVYAAYGPRKMLIDIFQPDRTAGSLRPAVVVVHGGGWQKGDKSKFRALAVELARRGYVTAAIEYRLATEAMFPAAIEDCLAAVRFLRSRAAEYGINPEQIAAVGGSAGGHLVGLMAAGATNPAFAEFQQKPAVSPEIQLAVVMAGPLQIATGKVAESSLTSTDSNAVLWFGGTVEQNPDMYHLADAYEQISAATPPIHFITGEYDNPTRNALAREKLKGLGVPTSLTVVPKAKHGCWNQLPWFTTCVDQIEALLQQQFGEFEKTGP